MNQANTMEIVIYKTKSGVTPEAHRTRALGVEKIMRNFDGFISRSFTEGEGGEWVDVVYWRDMNSAKKAMETAQGMQSSELGAFFSDIDESSIQMRHTAIIHPGR